MPTIIPNPPEGGPNGGAPAETFEILLQSLQAFALIHGFCIIKQRASNYRDKKPMRYDIVCDRGQGRPERNDEKPRNFKKGSRRLHASR